MLSVMSMIPSVYLDPKYHGIGMDSLQESRLKYLPTLSEISLDNETPKHYNRKNHNRKGHNRKNTQYEIFVGHLFNEDEAADSIQRKHGSFEVTVVKN